MPEYPLPFGEWLPDLGENENPGLVEAKNVIARPAGYEPVKAFGADSDDYADATADILAAYTDGANVSILSVDRFRNLGGTTTTGITSDLSPWVCATFGGGLFSRVFYLRDTASDSLYYESVFAYRTPLFSSFGYGAITEYTAQSISGVAIAKVGDFLMVGGGVAQNSPYDFRWSAFNNPIDWAVSQTTQAGIATVRDTQLGNVTGLHGGRYNLLFQENAVSRISYVGPPKIWATDYVSREFGAINHRCIVAVNDLVYFISKRGVCVTNGATVDNIGAGRVNEWLEPFMFNESSGSIVYDFRFYQRLHGVHDEENRQIIWNFCTEAAPTTFHQLIYSYETNRFTRAEMNTPVLAQQVVGTYRGTRLQAIVDGDSDGSFGPANYSGSALASEMTTGYRSLQPGKRIAINGFEPIYDGSGATAAVSTKQTLAGAATTGSYVGQTAATGIIDLRADGRLAAASVRFPAAASWSEFKGVVANGDVSGSR